MSPTQIKIAAAVLLVAGLFAGGLWTGRKLERAAWLDREVELNAEAADKIGRAAIAAAAAARAQGERMMAEVIKYYQGLEADRVAQDDFIAGVVSGRIRLSVPAKCPDRGPAESDAATGAGGTQGEARAELHDSAARFLDGEARRADAHTRQLNAVIGALEACETLAAAP